MIISFVPQLLGLGDCCPITQDLIIKELLFMKLLRRTQLIDELRTFYNRIM